MVYDTLYKMITIRLSLFYLIFRYNKILKRYELFVIILPTLVGSQIHWAFVSPYLSIPVFVLYFLLWISAFFRQLLVALKKLHDIVKSIYVFWQKYNYLKFSFINYDSTFGHKIWTLRGSIILLEILKEAKKEGVNSHWVDVEKWGCDEICSYGYANDGSKRVVKVRYFSITVTKKLWEVSIEYKVRHGRSPNNDYHFTQE